ncbi:hypothetical protein [Streptosporangium vulgare]|uniref:hypothetical protein n=1 Tax=Streptosporangium vulgare TaxID=46190 RepID=UPI0031D3C00B
MAESASSRSPASSEADNVEVKVVTSTGPARGREVMGACSATTVLPYRDRR